MIESPIKYPAYRMRELDRMYHAESTKPAHAQNYRLMRRLLKQAAIEAGRIEAAALLERGVSIEIKQDAESAT